MPRDGELAHDCGCSARFVSANPMDETEVSQMSKKTTSSKVQRDQQKLLEEALKRPGVAVAAEAYGRVQTYAQIQGTSTVKSGYATGGNAG
jgi:hypothetical protein